MTKATTRKTAQKKADKAPEPMDTTAREADAPVEYETNPRTCYAATTLLSEVAALFPDMTYVDGDRNGRGILLGVTFELASLSDEDAADFVNLFALFGDPAYNLDPRIEDVTHDEPEHLLSVTFKNQPRTYDLRSAFGLAEALHVLAGDEDDAEGIVFENDPEGSL